MNVAFLLKEYFDGKENFTIDVFDAHNLNDVYQDVLRSLTQHFEIEVAVLQAMSYCFYEILDNVHIHSGKPLGTVITHFDSKENKLRVLVADDGIGIQQSLQQNPRYCDISEKEALVACLQDSVGDGKGMGFGLYATSRLINKIGVNFVLHSGHHKLIHRNSTTEIINNGLWQGTIVFLEISTDVDLDPNLVVDFRTDVEGQYNEAFVETDELESLWSGKGATEFRFSDYGTDFGTRDMGVKLREKICVLLNDKGGVTLDFSGVNVVSNSFADECIAKLLLEMPLDELKTRISFRGLSPMAEKCILVALQRRYRSVMLS